MKIRDIFPIWFNDFTPRRMILIWVLVVLQANRKLKKKKKWNKEELHKKTKNIIAPLWMSSIFYEQFAKFCYPYENIPVDVRRRVGVMGRSPLWGTRSLFLKNDQILACLYLETNWQVQTWVSEPHCRMYLWRCPINTDGASEFCNALESQQLYPAGAEGHRVHWVSGLPAERMAIYPEFSPDIHSARKYHIQNSEYLEL